MYESLGFRVARKGLGWKVDQLARDEHRFIEFALHCFDCRVCVVLCCCFVNAAGGVR